jgi:hypothetical protein
VKRAISWLADNADAVIGLTIAVIASVLGVINLVPSYVILNVTVLMLATLSFIALRDRHRQETAARRIEESVATSRADVVSLFSSLRKVIEPMPDAARLAEWQETVTKLGTALRHVSMVQVVPGEEIAHLHTMARVKTERWVFKGGTGTYLRAVTLPACVDSARKEHRPIEVQFEIIDPTDRDLCARYAAFRSSLEPGPDGAGEYWTLDRTRKEAFATILAACWHRQHFTPLKISGGLSAVMTTFRTDMSSSHVIITQESGTSPALVAEAGKPHFSAYEQELQSSFDQAKPVQLSLAREVPLSDEPTVDEARRLFTRVGTPLPSTFTDRDVSDIIAKALRPRNPYK